MVISETPLNRKEQAASVYRVTEIPTEMNSDQSLLAERVDALLGSCSQETRRVIQKTYDILRKNRVAVSDSEGVAEVFTTPSLSDGAEDSHLDYAGKQWLWDSAAPRHESCLHRATGS